MICINCHGETTAVINSRPNKTKPRIWRRRRCEACGTVFTTTEHPLYSELLVKHSTKQEPFSLSRLTLSIAAAFSHKPSDGQYHSLELAETVLELLGPQHSHIDLETLTARCYEVLKRYDEIAAMQYAAKHGLMTSIRRRGRPSTAWRAPETGASPYR